MEKSLITTHVLNTATGQPAAAVPVTLAQQSSAGWQTLAHAHTDVDGRVSHWGIANGRLIHATYRLHFDLAAYLGADSFFPYAELVFKRQDNRHLHVPLLLSPFGYTTYRGS